MSQQGKTPAVMVRIRSRLRDVILNNTPEDAVDKLLSEGWIDVDWAADHTRFLKANLDEVGKD